MSRLLLALMLVALPAAAQEAPPNPTALALAEVAEVERLWADFGRQHAALERLTIAYQKAQAGKDGAALRRITADFEQRRGPYEALEKQLPRRIRAARTQLGRALLSDPDPRLYAGRAKMHAFLGDHARALADADQAVRRAPKDLGHRLERGRYRFDDSQWTAALADVDACLAAGHEVARCQLFRGQLLFYLARYDDALKAFDAAASSTDETIAAQADGWARDVGEYRTRWAAEQARRATERTAADLPRVTLVTDKGEITVELFETEAPNSTANFIELVERRFYDGTRFHRVEPNGLVQGGDPTSARWPRPAHHTWSGHAGYAIPDELGPPRRDHLHGSLAMAKRGPHTAGSQFYFTLRPMRRLDGRYTVFGVVVEGLEVLRRLRPGDRIRRAVVVRKRDHPYKVIKLD